MAANLLGLAVGATSTVLDVILGPLATLLAAYLTSRMKKQVAGSSAPRRRKRGRNRRNAAFVYMPADQVLIYSLIYGAGCLGELVVCYALGLPLLYLLSATDWRSALTAICDTPVNL